MIKTRKSRKKAGLYAAASALSLMLGASAYGQDAETKIFNIEAQPLSEALLDFSRQSEINVIAPSAVTRGLTARPVSGELTPEDALRAMLGDASLELRPQPDGSIVLAQVVTEASPREASFRVAQASFQDDETVAEVSSDANADEEGEERDVIVVTGTRIAGAPPASPVTVISRAEIDARGLSSIEDVLRYIPQNYSTITSGGLADGRGVRNVSGATTVNLRGLGEGSTLVLVNGKRIAASPSESGTFTDISTIPFGAVERIEVLTDGASAIYGSDAVGGVINIILRRDYSGAQTRLRYENSSSGGDLYNVDQTLGFSWGSGNLTANASYSQEDPVDRFEAGLTDITDFTAQGGRVFFPFETQLGQNPARTATLSQDLTPDTEQWSAYANLTQDITDKLELNVSGQYSDRESVARTVAQAIFAIVPPSNFYNDTGDFQFIDYALLAEGDAGAVRPPTDVSSSERFSINASLDWETPIKDWVATVGFGYSQDEIAGGLFFIDSRSDELAAALDSSDVATALNVFGDGSMQRGDLNSLITFRDNGSRTGKQEVFNFGLTGTAFAVPAGGVKFSLGAELRDDTLNLSGYRLDPFSRSDETLADFEPTTENQAFFAEIFIPIVGENTDLPFVHDLSLQLAGRYDNYDITGPFDGFDASGTMLLPFSSRSFDDFVPKVGLVWYPVESLKVRATWGEAFQIPTIPELFTPPVVSSFPRTVFDPRNPASNGGPGPVQVPRISGGNADLRPQTSETFTVGFDYSPVETLPGLDVSLTYSQVDFKDRLGSLGGVFGFSNIFGMEPFPVINSELFPGAVERDADGVLTTFIPFGTFNLSSRKSESLDFRVSQSFDTGFGDFEVGTFGTHTLKLEDLPAPGVDPVQQAGSDVAPSDWVVNGFVDWFHNDWTASVIVNHSSGYTNSDESANIRDVDGYTTVDLNASYTLADTGWRFITGINNVFDADFPFVDNTSGIDSSRVNFRRRVIYFELSKEFSF